MGKIPPRSLGMWVLDPTTPTEALLFMNGCLISFKIEDKKVSHHADANITENLIITLNTYLLDKITIWKIKLILVSFILSPTFFLYMDAIFDLYYFPSGLRNCFNIFLQGIYDSNELPQILFFWKNILPLLLIGDFVGYRSLGWFSFKNTQNISFHSLLACMVFDEKSTVVPVPLPL